MGEQNLNDVVERFNDRLDRSFRTLILQSISHGYMRGDQFLQD